MIKRVLTIAGSDSGGGAGVQADLKTIALYGGFGMSVITALTAQNTLGIQDVYPIPIEFIKRQIDSVVTDIGVDAVKTGMLVNSDVVKAVANKMREYEIEKLIVDPVMVAKGGRSVLYEDALDALKSELIPLAFLITPNLHEASKIWGRKVENTEEMKKAALEIFKRGASNVLIKGGHLPGRSIDILFNGKEYFEYDSDRIHTANTHGTGCVYSAFLALEIAMGSTVSQAVKNAKDFIAIAIKSSLDLGKGHGPVNPYAAILREI
ncbi:MAG: bifunctional hydroxymethylpyrimidine kinase/phosphomethylpyrimidine kinase [Thermodesulfobacteriota bacterium]|nr:bifunctional hydroxymethylpyrimidine kinase/phosphomethylpyrimidine kinase [Thermodesulfobacteriota bacterium]